MSINTDIDKLGALQAQISDLQAEAKVLADSIKEYEPGAYEGDLFRATVSDCETFRVDWKSIANKLNPSRQLIAGNTSVGHSVRLVIKARLRVAA